VLPEIRVDFGLEWKEISMYSNPIEVDTLPVECDVLYFECVPRDDRFTDLDRRLSEVDKGVRDIAGQLPSLAEGVKALKSASGRTDTPWSRAGSLALVGICVTAIIFAVSEASRNSEFRGEARAELSNLQADVRELRAVQSSAKIIKEISTLDRAQFARNLPALRKAMEQPASAAAAQPATLRDVAAKLKVVDEATADYWPTVLRFIQFASAGLSANVPPPGAKANVIIGQNRGFVNLGPFKNCVAELDGGDLGPTRFENCRVRFTQNPIRFLNVSFINCVFEMPDTASPTPYLKRASQLLLASDLKNVSISAPL
jgi:hypothetical protein